MARTIEEKIEPEMVIGKLTVLKQAEPGKRGSVTMQTLVQIWSKH